MTFIAFTFLFFTINIVNAQNDSLIRKIDSNKYIYKNLIKNNFYIKNNKKTIWKNLKYFEEVAGYYQILSKNNKPIFIDKTSLKEIKNPELICSICGANFKFKYKIVRTEDKYIIKCKTEYLFSEDFSDNDFIDIDSFSNIGIIKAYFINETDTLELSDKAYRDCKDNKYKTAVFVIKDKQVGVFFEKNIQYFDESYYTFGGIYIKKNNLYGYYGITDNIFRYLSYFNGNLAFFILPNGQTGYVDKNGFKYFDK